MNNGYLKCPAPFHRLNARLNAVDKAVRRVAQVLTVGEVCWGCSSPFQGASLGSPFLCRHVRNGAVIARCSQPEISWWGWRNADDEYLVTSIAKACALNPGVKVSGGLPHNGSSDGSEACDADFGETAYCLPLSPKCVNYLVLPTPQCCCCC